MELEALGILEDLRQVIQNWWPNSGLNGLKWPQMVETIEIIEYLQVVNKPVFALVSMR